MCVCVCVSLNIQLQLLLFFIIITKTLMSTLSEAFRDFPLHLHHIIPLDFNSARVVPESHIWPKSDDFSSHDCDQQQPTNSLPLIDLNDPQAKQLIGDACETWGAFQVVNHGIPLNLLNDAESETRRLFSLPTTQKLKALRAPGGATGYGIARITPFFSKYMWHEGFTVIGSPFEHAKQLWPHDDAQFCDVIENYQKEMRILAERLTKLIFKSLEISEKSSTWVASNSTNALQLNSYPSCPDPNRALGLAPHTDTSLLTILRQSSISGLQIFKEGVGWVSVLPISNALVVNVGDLLHILSNARFPNVLHRVLVNQKRQRLSMAYFYCPPMEFELVPVTASGQAPRYRPVTKKEFISIKAKHLDKALSLIKL